MGRRRDPNTPTRAIAQPVAVALLDTGVVSCLLLSPENEKDRQRRWQYKDALESHEMATCPVVVGEILDRRFLNDLTAQEEKIVREFCGRCRYLDITKETPHIYATLGWHRKFQNDRWIASIASENNAVLFTRDQPFYNLAKNMVKSITFG